MAKAKQVEPEAEPYDWANLPEPEGGFVHDVMDPTSHTWYEIETWHSIYGETGERRLLACSGCEIPPITQMRAADPDDPLPEIGAPDDPWLEGGGDPEDVVIPEPEPVAALSEADMEAFQAIEASLQTAMDEAGLIEPPEPEETAEELDALRAAALEAEETPDGPDAE